MMFNYNSIMVTGSAKRTKDFSLTGSSGMSAGGSLASGISGSGTSSGGGNYGSSGTYLGGVDLSYPLLQDILNTNDQLTLDNTYREIYLMDPISGPVVDMLSMLPWSDYALIGIEDSAIKALYESSLSELCLQRLMKLFMTSNYVLGRGLGSLVFDKNRGIFTDCILYNVSEAEISPIPFIGYDPKVNIKLSKDFKKWLLSTDPRDEEAKKELSQEDIAKMSSSNKLELEPLKTIYVERTNLPGSSGVSLFSRILPIWLLEKCLLRGTILSATRRQKSILHITMGSEEVDYDQPQMQAVAEMFANADRDPLGAAVVTRPDVNVSEVRCIHGDTLISTEKGDARIADLVKHNPDDFNGKRTSFPLNIKVRGYYGDFVETSEWHYSGYASTVKVTTGLGNTIICTPEHKLRAVYRNSVEWIEAKDSLGKHVFVYTPNSYDPNIMDVTVSEVVSVEEYKKCHVYDLSVKHVKTAFLANGIVVHNSPSDLWSHSSETESFTQAKLRAMGVSDSFLSGDATYTNQENTIGLMLESLRVQRAELTKAIILDKVFLSLAKYHNFRKRTEAEVAHNIRYDVQSSKAKRNEKWLRYAQLTGSRNMAEMSVYVIPDVKWAKDLKPIGSSSELSLMKDLNDSGIPVPAAVLAASAGVDIDTLVSSYENDIEIRKKIADYKKKLQKFSPNEEGEEDNGGFSLESSNKVSSTIEPISLKNRATVEMLASTVLGRSIELKPTQVESITRYIQAITKRRA